MNCAEVEDLLNEDLESSAIAEVAEHLDSCGKCAEMRRQLEAIEDLNRQLMSRLSAPSDFSGKIVSEVSRRRTLSGFTSLALVLGGLLVFAGGFELSQQLSGFLRTADENGDRLAAEEGIQVSGVEADRIEDGQIWRLPPSGAAYTEVMITGESGDAYIVRIPSTIQIRRTNAAQDYLVKVSH